MFSPDSDVTPLLSIRRSEQAPRRFSLMSHWFYNMIGFGRASQIQKGNENVV
jgi:hypothetical protein